jgi:putative membrane protein
VGAVGVLVMICILLAQPAFAQSVGEKTGANSVLGIPPKPADFVKEAAESDLFEIQSSQLAVSKTDGKVKEIAEQMVADHTQMFGELKSQAQKASIALPTEIGISQQRMLAKLGTLDGDDFTQQYLDDQVIVHKEAISLFKRFDKGAKDSELKAWATQTLPTLQRDLDMAQALDKTPND